MDLKKLLEEVRQDREIAERAARLHKKAPHPSQAFKPGSDGWMKAKRKELKKERELEDKELEQKINRALAQARYHRKNKARLNQARIKRLRWPKPTYERAKRRAERRGQVWDISFDDWWDMWQNAPRCWNPEKGFWDTAWNMRGGNPRTDCQMTRKDTDGPFSADNLCITLPSNDRSSRKNDRSSES